MFVPVRSKSGVSSLLVSQESFQHHFLRQPIDLSCDIGCGPVHRLMKRLHCLGGQLNLALAWLAIFQPPDVVGLQREAIEIGKLRRITELLVAR